MQHGGEVEICKDPWHAPLDQPVPTELETLRSDLAAKTRALADAERWTSDANAAAEKAYRERDRAWTSASNVEAQSHDLKVKLEQARHEWASWKIEANKRTDERDALGKERDELKRIILEHYGDNSPMSKLAIVGMVKHLVWIASHYEQAEQRSRALRTERDNAQSELAEQKQALTAQAASLLRAFALAPCSECETLRGQVETERKRADAAVYMLNSPKAALEMCGILEEHDKERKARLDRTQKRLAECEPVIEAVRDHQEDPSDASKIVRLLLMPLPEKVAP